MPLEAANGTFVGIVLVRGDDAAIATAQRLLSWYDAATPLAPRISRDGRTELYNPDARFASARLVAARRRWAVRDLAEIVASPDAVVVTPDGDWHERKGSESPTEWRERAADLLADHDHFAALVYEFATSD